MENLDSVWQIGIIALLIGLAAGILAQRLISRPGRETEDLRQARDAAQQELEQYRESVNQHFDKTSELVNDLTQNYVRVYQHLAEGAQTLGDSKTLNNLLEQQPGRVSIALDEDTRPTAEVVPETVVPPVAEPVDEHAEAFNADTAPAVVTETSPPESGVEAPEAASAESTDSADERQAETVEAEPDSAASEAASASSDSEPETDKPRDAAQSDEAAEAVLNVDALDEALEKSDDKLETASPPADKTDSGETRTTTH